MAKRSRLDIIADMLYAIQDKGGRIKPTHLMYKSNLSHTQMMTYLEELLHKHLIGKISQKGYEYIIITDQGYQFWHKVKEMREFEKTFGI